MSRFLTAVQSALTALCSILRPVVGSVNGALIPGEIKRAVIAGLAASGVAGFATLALKSFAGDTNQLFSSPEIAALVAGILVHVAALVGQLGHTATGLHQDDLLEEGLTTRRDMADYLDKRIRSAKVAYGSVDLTDHVAVDASDVLSAYAQKLISQGEARTLLFPEFEPIPSPSATKGSGLRTEDSRDVSSVTSGSETAIDVPRPRFPA